MAPMAASTPAPQEPPGRSPAPAAPSVPSGPSGPGKGGAVVVGASSGIGAALVRRLAGEGWNVAALARRSGELERLARECQGLPGRVFVHVHDTRRLKGAARQMYRGVHQGKYGLKALIGDPDRALEQVTKILGLYSSEDEKAVLRQKLKHDAERHSMDLEAKRLEIIKSAKDLENPDDEPPTPTMIVVEVKDARKHDSDAES